MSPDGARGVCGEHNVSWLWPTILTGNVTNSLSLCMKIITMHCYRACTVPSFQRNSALLALSVGCSLCLKGVEFKVLLLSLVVSLRNSLNPSEHIYLIISTMKIQSI